jgi:hypothetical protein
MSQEMQLKREAPEISLVKELPPVPVRPRTVAGQLVKIVEHRLEYLKKYLMG